MPFISSPLRVAIARASSDGRYEGRWPGGDKPTSIAAIAAAIAAGLAALTTGSGTGLTYPTPNTGTDKFVSASASGSGNGAFASPWTLTQAFANLTAGQRCWLRGGNYTMPSDATNAASGTAGNPIELCAYPAETVNCTFPSGGMLFDGNSYWNFWGGNWSCVDTAIKFAIDLASSNLGFYYVTGTQSIQDGDNCGIIFCNGTLDGAGFDYLDVQLCDFSGSWNGGGAGVQNVSLIYPRKIKHYNIVGNKLRNCWNLIYGKQEITSTLTSGQVARTIKNNILTDSGRYIDAQSDFAQYLHNRFLNCNIQIGEDDGTRAGGTTSVVRNNTFHNSNITFKSPAGFNGTFIDNALSGTSKLIALYNSASDPLINSDHNLVIATNPFAANFTNYSLSAWRALGGSSTRDPNSLSGSASYAGGSSPTTDVPADWVLSAPSAALTLSSTGGPVGCDTTKLLTVN